MDLLSGVKSLNCGHPGKPMIDDVIIQSVESMELTDGKRAVKDDVRNEEDVGCHQTEARLTSFLTSF